MGDARVRELERSWQETGAPEDERRLLRERLRLDPAALPLADLRRLLELDPHDRDVRDRHHQLQFSQLEDLGHPWQRHPQEFPCRYGAFLLEGYWEPSWQVHPLLAWHQPSRRACEVVILDSDGIAAARVEEDLQDLEQKLTGLSAIEHEHLAGTIDVSLAPPAVHLALDREPAGSRTVLHDAERLAPQEAVDLIEPIADAVAAGHAQGVVHGGITPTNVFRVADGSPRVVGFGRLPFLALGHDWHAYRHTQMHAAHVPPNVRSMQHLSPEAVKGEPLGPASDVFQLGALLYELVAGRPAFAGDESMRVLYRICTQPPTPLRELQPECSVALEGVCVKALAKKPEERYPDAPAFLEAVRRLSP